MDKIKEDEFWALYRESRKKLENEGIDPAQLAERIEELEALVSQLLQRIGKIDGGKVDWDGATDSVFGLPIKKQKQ